MKITLKEAGKGREVCEAEIAGNFWKRFRGLMFRKRIPENFGLILEFPEGRKNRAIHTFFMRFQIDLVFLDPKGKVVEIKTLGPWRYYSPKKECKWVLELLGGRAKRLGLHPGDEVRFETRG